MAARFVVDNSVVMAWCFADESSRYAERVLASLEQVEAVVPSQWPLEAANVLLVAERRKRLTRADAAKLMTLLTRLPLVVEQESPARILTEVYALAREFQLSAHDAAYLDLALRGGWPLATQDKSLLKAAKRAGVPIFAVK
ncbi:MAG: PIN domain-containing protein [Candidatus Hydrogenedens sp.]|nr:PIN domain-containing protein [Candidatus Hydrogenedens sp.]